MTTQSRDGSQRSEFGAWMRKQQELDSKKYGISLVDIDWCINRFLWVDPINGQRSRRLQNMMMIEEKCYDAEPSFSQSETLRALATILYPSRKSNNKKPQPSRYKYRNNSGEMSSVLWWGYHLLQFSNTTPDNSELLRWDNHPITPQQLILILRFEVSPLTGKPRDNRDHHGKAGQGKLW